MINTVLCPEFGSNFLACVHNHDQIASSSVFCLCNIVPPLNIVETRPHSHIMFTMLIYVFGISGVVFHRDGGCSIKSFRFWLIIYGKNGHIDPRISQTN